MLFFSRPSSTFASTSQCRNAPTLPPRPATASCHSRARSTSSEAFNRPRVHSLVSWELVPTAKLSPLSSPASVPSASASHSPPPEEESVSWEVVNEDTSALIADHSYIPSLDGFSPASAELSRSDPEHTSLSEFDTEAFPSHAHLFPSSPNGTWRNESLHALTHPTAVDYKALCNKLRALVEEASDEVSGRVNRVFEGSDVPAIHDKVLKIIPSVSMPDMRGLERAVDAGCEWRCGLLERRHTRSRGREG
jgi:hypothetical protein